MLFTRMTICIEAVAKLQIIDFQSQLLFLQTSKINGLGVGATYMSPLQTNFATVSEKAHAICEVCQNDI